MKRSPLNISRRFCKKHPAASRTAWRLLGISTAIFALQAPRTGSAQTAYSWGLGSTGGAWTTATNWTPTTGYPGQNAGDTAALTDTSANRVITLNASETIAGLTFAETSGFINELDIQPNTTGTTAATATTALTNSSTLNLTATSGTSLLFLDDTTNTKGDAQYNGNITVGNNGTIEMSAYSNGSTANTSNITGNVTVGSGTANGTAALNVDLPVTTGGFDGSFITGNLTLQTGGTITLGKTTASSGVALGGTGVRFTQTGGAFLASGGTINAPGAASTNVINMAFGGTSATFDSSVNGTFFTAAAGTTTITLNSAQSSSTGASIFTLASDVALPNVNIVPTNAATSNTVNMTLQSVTAGNTLSLTNLGLTPGPNASGTGKAGALEVTLGSNVTVGNTTYGLAAGAVVTFNLANFTLTNNHNFATVSNASSFNIVGTGGTLSALSFTFNANTGTTGTSVGAGVTLLATGAASGTGIVNNLGNAAGTIDPTSTFRYTGTATGANTNTLTSNRAIGQLVVGNGTAASILNLATAALPVGAGVTVQTNSTLDLATFSLTETSVAGATTGGLNGAGTIQSTGGTPTLTLDTTRGNGTFTGIITNGTGVVALTKNGTGTQTLSGVNTYSGPTTVTAGMLTLSATGSINSSTLDSLTNPAGTAMGGGALTLNNASALSNTGTLSLVSGTTLNLNATSGSEIIGALVLDGTTEAPGTYTAAQLTGLDSGITFSSLDGETLTIAAVPEPTTMVQAGMVLAFIFGASACKRIKQRRANVC